MRSLLALSVILVCIMDKSDGTFADFMNNLPDEVLNAFSNAWSSITDAIKKPVRIKRLGPGGRLKTSTTTMASTFSPSEEDQYYQPTDYHNPERTEHTTASIGNKLTLPLLMMPEFKTIDDWRNMQKAHYADKKKVENRGPILLILDGSYTKPKSVAQVDQESFATLMYL